MSLSVRTVARGPLSTPDHPPVTMLCDTTCSTARNMTAAKHVTPNSSVRTFLELWTLSFMLPLKVTCAAGCYGLLDTRRAPNTVAGLEYGSTPNATANP